MDMLTDPVIIHGLMRKYRFSTIKSLGQNFLIDSEIPRKIVSMSDIGPESGVIEIGAGIGTLTNELAKVADKVVAVELDQKLIPVLQETLSEHKNVKIIHGDILKLNINELIDSEFPNQRVCICANLPYYITTPIIMRLIENRSNISDITVMVQKEVALRLTSVGGGKEYGAVSIAVQYYAESKVLFDVGSNCFMPQPKVVSSVIKLKIRENPPVEVEDEKWFFKVIHASFSQRRKTLINSLSNTTGINKAKIAEALNDLGLDVNVRGEKLSIYDYALLCKKLKKVE